MEALQTDVMDDECFDKATVEANGDGRNNSSSENVEPKAETKSANFVLPPRKRLKTSSTAVATVYPGSSSGTSSPTSPPSSPSPLHPLSPSSLGVSFVVQDKVAIEEGKKQKKKEKEGKPIEKEKKKMNGELDQKKASEELRKSKKRKSTSKPLFEPSLFTPLPPRQAKVDSYKKSRKDNGRETTKNGTKAKPQKKRKIKHESSDSDSEEEEVLYCICRQPYDSNQFMIACDTCDDWFHVKCVNITERKAKTLATYICPLCKEKKENEKAEKQKRRREEEKEKERKREAKRLKKEKEAQAAEVQRVCANESCKGTAKPSSKYCSTKCGILVAKQKLSERQRPIQSEGESVEKEKRDEPSVEGKEKSDEELLKSKTLSVSESEDLKSLKLLESQKLDTEVNLTLLKEKRLKLMEAIKFSATLVAPTDATKPKKNKTNGGTMDIMDCFSCGQPIPGKNFARHMEQCYAKKEGNVYTSAYKNDDQVAADGTTLTYCNYYDARSGSYCTRLADSCPFHSEKKKQKAKRNQLCGCPTTDFESGHCERLKRECGKHVNWEIIRTDELDLELKRLTQLLASVQEEIEIVKSRIKRRSMLDDTQHRTIEEN